MATLQSNLNVLIRERLVVRSSERKEDYQNRNKFNRNVVFPCGHVFRVTVNHKIFELCKKNKTGNPLPIRNFKCPKCNGFVDKSLYEFEVKEN